ncbi:MAG: glycosyltransferase family 4 protein [Candidatus Vogelbacteria bacterium]|nr:glycosyltransferase family 4 protein [Candidatus Vogelbacteria bacterium]
MKLLILTQKVDINDDILGFMHGWIREFANHVEKITVICLQQGEYYLPKNVSVSSLGKEGGQSRFKYLWNFYKYIWQERKNYDTVFVHMNPIYLVFGGFFWKLQGKKTALWYTHRKVDLKLKIAEKFVDVIFTASKESFQLESDKIKVLGHGIPIDDFKNPNTLAQGLYGNQLKIISVGRITPIKNLDTLVEAANILNDRGVDFKITLVGGTINEGDEKYLEKLKKMVNDFRLNDCVVFAGSVPNREIKKYYWENDFSINLCPAGGVDKAVLESMAAGLLVIVSNKAFADYLGEFKDTLLFRERDEEDLVDKIISLKNSKQIVEIRRRLFEETKKRAGLFGLVVKIVEGFDNKRN